MSKVKDFNCMDCQVDTKLIEERYMVKDDVWLKANPTIKGLLCIGCLEKRLNRKLNSEDFTDAPINAWKCQSPRLADRLENLKFKRNITLYMLYKETLKSDFAVVEHLLHSV